MNDKYQILISFTGEISIMAQDGTFEGKAMEITELMSFLQENGIQMDEVLPAEAHRHDEHGNHVHAHHFTENHS